jgi:hypothetical protein
MLQKTPSGIVFDPDTELPKSTRNQVADTVDKTFSSTQAVSDYLLSFCGMPCS